MKILKEKSRVYKGKHYHKYKVNIPKKILDKAGFKKGMNLSVKAKKVEIKLTKREK